MTMLSIIQDHCRLHTLAVPSSVIGSTDTTTNQLFAIVKELLDDMVEESKFNVTTTEATFTTTAAMDQGAMETLAPNGYQWAINETFFDRTLARPLYGPLNEVEWQQIQALPDPGPFYKFRIRGNRLLMHPTPTAPFSTIAFEYMSNWCVTSAAGTLKAALTADDDLFVFPEKIIRKGMTFYWKRAKGLPYQADETQYWSLLNKYIARDKAKRRINLAEPCQPDIRPGVFVPTGNWNV